VAITASLRLDFLGASGIVGIITSTAGSDPFSPNGSDIVMLSLAMRQTAAPVKLSLWNSEFGDGFIGSYLAVARLIHDDPDREGFAGHWRCFARSASTTAVAVWMNA
jgi:hypothetical protein